MRSYGKSVKGTGPVLEDAYDIRREGIFTIMVISDGIGGENGGETASQIASKRASELTADLLMDRQQMIPYEEFSDRMTSVFQKINKEIVLEASGDPSLLGMGATLTVAVIAGREVLIAHIGDSRAYLIHGSSVTRLTEDHTLASELLKNSSITMEEYLVHEGRNKLVRSLGENKFITPDIYRYNIIYGDMILLMTDGAYGVLSEKDISLCLKEHNDLETCAEKILELAGSGGSKDDMTAVMTLVVPDREKEHGI